MSNKLKAMGMPLDDGFRDAPPRRLETDQLPQFVRDNKDKLETIGKVIVERKPKRKTKNKRY